jgi:CrcB protein
MSSVLFGYLLVFFGGGLGAAMRYGVTRVAFVINPDYPLGTLAVNILGCLVMGLLTAWFTFRGEDTTQPMRLLLTTGILGGFTTFSAFSLDAALLWERGHVMSMLGYILLSVMVSIAAVFAGLAAGRTLFS